MADLMYGANETVNQANLNFTYNTLKYYKSTSDGIDLVVLLGNAVDGSQWDQ